MSSKQELWDQLQAAVRTNQELRVENKRLLGKFVYVALTIEGSAEKPLIEWATKYLEGRGYSVMEPNRKWETPKEIGARLGIHVTTLSRNVTKANAPHVAVRRGESGRIIEVLSNAHFDAFLLRGKAKPQKPTIS